VSVQNIEIICLGEVLIDVIAVDESLTKFHRYFGGSPANVAVHLAKLGHKTAFAGSVGNDFLGDYIIHSLEINSVDMSLMTRISKPTSIVFLNEFVDPPIPIYYKSADYQYYFSNELRLMIDQASILHTSAHALSYSPMRETVQKALKYAHRKGKIITFEPNYRSMINLEDSEFKSIVSNAISCVDFIKPSSDDASELFGNYLSPNEIITKFQKLGVKKSVILTCGSEGVYFLDENMDVQFRSVVQVDKVIGITGAGDAFWSGFLSSILKQRTIKHAIDLGLQLAAEKLRYSGAIT